VCVYVVGGGVLKEGPLPIDSVLAVAGVEWTIHTLTVESCLYPGPFFEDTLM
jgi:hypothetical protein